LIFGLRIQAKNLKRERVNKLRKKRKMAKTKNIFMQILMIFSVLLLFVLSPLIPLILLIIILIFSYKGIFKWIIVAIAIIIIIIDFVFTSAIEGVTESVLFIEYLVLILGIIILEIVLKFRKKESG
jgi:hypothetical protein